MFVIVSRSEQSDRNQKVVVEDSDEDDDVDIEPVEPTIQSTAEAIRIADDLQRFASSRLKDENLVADLMKISQCIQDFRLTQQRQSNITEFFSA